MISGKVGVSILTVVHTLIMSSNSIGSNLEFCEFAEANVLSRLYLIRVNDLAVCLATRSYEVIAEHSN